MTAAARTPTTAAVVQQALRGRRRSIGGMAFEGSLLLALLLSLGILVALIGDLLAGGLGVLTDHGWQFVTSGQSLNADTAGVGSAIIGSIALTVVVAAVAFPIGIGAAIYLEEYARDTRLNRFISTNIRNLAGVPSIVFGLLGLAIFVKFVSAIGLGGSVGGRNVIAGGLTLAVLVLPIIIITSAEALRAVPDSLREAGFGVGATRWEVIRYHVLPAAAPGILTGTVLTLARAFGETAPLLLVGAATGFFAAAQGAPLMDQITGKYAALPVLVFSWARQPDAAFRELTAAAGLVLVVVLLISNAAAIVLRNRYETKW